jgi:phosphate transport system permease protein
MRPRSTAGRKALDTTLRAIATLAALAGILTLLWILGVVIQKGHGALDAAFFTELPAHPGSGHGGLAGAILGTLLLTGVATLVGGPLGLLAGVYLSEFGRTSRPGAAIRFAVNVLLGLPPILVGLFVWTILVVPAGGFSGYAGAVALALIVLPLVARSTEETLALMPSALREGALALGTPRWKVTLLAIRCAKGGLVTGFLLAVTRVSGETAPLLVTALNSPSWPRSFSEPMSNLGVTIYQYARSPYEDWQAKAWGASLVIMAGVLTSTLLARTFARGRRS